jgi:teichuronic acid exporter
LCSGAERSLCTFNTSSILSDPLKAKTANSLQWSAAETCVRQGLQFAFAIVLARLLTPHDFGVMALMVVFVGVSNALVDGGFGAALIQRKNPTDGEVTAVFGLNVALGAIVALVLALCAGWVAAFFATPVLQAVVWFAALNVFISSFGVVQLALLLKALDFRSYFFVTVFSSGLAGLVAVGMAWQGFGVWSLVGQALVATALGTLMLWYCVRWRPSGGFQWRALGPMWRFGSAVMISGILEMLAGRLVSLVIGRSYTVGDLGIYSRAESTRDMGSTLVSRTVTRVAFPMFSAAADNRQLLFDALRKTLRVVMYFNVPGMAALGFLAPQLIPLIYGPQWTASVPFLQILAIAGLLMPMCLVNLELLKSSGRTGLYFRAEMVKKLLMVVGVLATFKISIAALAWGQVAAVLLFFVLVAVATGRLVGYGIIRQTIDLWQPLAAAAAMLVSMAGVAGLAPEGGVVPLLGQVAAGGAVYLAVNFLVRSDVQRELFGHASALLMRRLAWEAK